MSKKSILFGTIASVLALNAFADPVTITTQDYVDTNFQTKIPAQQANWPKEIITATNTPGVVGTAGIYDTDYRFYDASVQYDPNIANYLPTMTALHTAFEDLVDPAVTNSAFADAAKQIPVFSGGSDKFKKVITTNTLDYQGTWDTGNVIPTLTAVSSGMATKQDKMTCAQYIENAEQTSANCLLWNVPD